MPSHKLTRKELKHDGFVDWTGRASDFLQVHYMRVGIVVLLILALILGVRLVREGQRRSAQRASYLLYQGQSLLLRGDHLAARGPLQEVVDRFGGTPFGKQAALGLAQAQLAGSEPDQALTSIERAARGLRANDPLALASARLRAAALITLQRLPEAENVYRDLLAVADLPDEARLELALALADCLKLAGRPADGAQVLVELLARIERGELKVQGRERDLESRIQLLKALAG